MIAQVQQLVAVGSSGGTAHSESLVSRNPAEIMEYGESINNETENTSAVQNSFRRRRVVKAALGFVFGAILGLIFGTALGGAALGLILGAGAGLMLGAAADWRS
jgi:hypothetical protein